MSVFTFNTQSHLQKNMFFDEQVDIARYDRVKYQQFEKLIRQQISYFWVPEEVDLTRDTKDFKGLDPFEQFLLTANLKRQILLDSVQGRAPGLAFLPIVSLPELETWIQTWTFFETLHSRSYTHILRNVFPDPSKVFDEMLDTPEIVDCAEDISEYYDNLIKFNNAVADRGYINGLTRYNHKRDLWLCLNAVNFLEGIRFYVSFAVTWNFAELKKMEGNAKIIKFICRDENLHLASTQHILKLLPKEDPDFKKIQEECRPEVLQMVDNVVSQEKTWAQFLFKNGSMIGLNENLLCDFVDERADKCLKNLGYDTQYGNKKNVLPYTAKWIAGGDVQVAPQETDISSYTIGGIKQDIDQDKLKGFTL